MWHKVKNFFLDQKKKYRVITELKQSRNQINAFFGASGETGKKIDNLIDAALRYRKLSYYLGTDIVRLLRVRRPELGFAQIVGIDLNKEINLIGEVLMFEDIKLPFPQNDVDRKTFYHEIQDVVFPSYLKRRFENYDRYLILFGDQLLDFNEGPYEYEHVCLKKGDIVFDCGANMGLFSATASRYGAQVFAFEAIPDIIDNYLSKAAEMNGNIHVCNYAVWDKEEILEFSYIRHNIGGSRCSRLVRGASSQNHIQVAVPAITLDAFVEKNGIPRVDFIKADIEGAERSMLRGAKKVLKEFAPKLSICTYHLPDDPQVFREIILEANPKYIIVEKFKKMYAYVP